MSGSSLTFDGQPVPLQTGDTVLAAALRAGHELPHLCWHPQLGQSGACRLCTVQVDGRLAAACTTAAAPGQVVACHTPDLAERRRLLVQMLFIEGNHFCPGCEKSGDCRLQDAGYALGITDQGFEPFHPNRPVDASHPDIWLDLNRCILCKLCLRASREVDGKGVFAISGHGVHTHIVVDAPSGRLGDSTLAATDLAAHICPVGAILPKRRGFAVPIGSRPADARTAGGIGPGAAAPAPPQSAADHD